MKHWSNVWQNPNDPDNENEHFKQQHIATEKGDNRDVIGEQLWRL